MTGGPRRSGGSARSPVQPGEPRDQDLEDELGLEGRGAFDVLVGHSHERHGLADAR